MECEFISLCNYNIYVSADLYANYYDNVRHQFKQIKNHCDGKPQNISLRQIYKQRIKGDTKELQKSEEKIFKIDNFTDKKLNISNYQLLKSNSKADEP